MQNYARWILESIGIVIQANTGAVHHTFKQNIYPNTSKRPQIHWREGAIPPKKGSLRLRNLRCAGPGVTLGVR
jgi:hypothetical protein